jgi:tetratricopeptide (TPR) repeat protein
MDLAETLRRLAAADGDPSALALATIDIVLASHGPDVGLALEAAAVPHWFDQEMLRRMLGTALPSNGDWFERLAQLTVVERFQGHNALNVHEVTRLALRHRLADDRPDRFRALSTVAAEAVDGTHWKQAVERVYHRLTCDPARGVTELRQVWKAWIRTAQLQPLQALGKALDELCAGPLLEPTARTYALVALGNIRENRIALRTWEDTARQAVALARTVGDATALGDALLLLGRVLRVQGRLGDSLASYEEARTHLIERPPGALDESELVDTKATLHEEIGKVLLDRGRNADALQQFEASMALRQHLCAQEPHSELRRRELAVAHADFGDALISTPRSNEAESYYLRALTVIEAPHGEDFGDESVQQNIARLRMRLGEHLGSRGNTAGAMTEYGWAEAAFRTLAACDAEHLSWKGDLADACLRIGFVELGRDNLAAAEQRMAAAREICLDLIERDPANPTWKHALGGIHSAFGTLRERQANFVEAAKEAVQAEHVLAELSESDPDAVQWKVTHSTARIALGRQLQRLAEALEQPDEKGAWLMKAFHQFISARTTLHELVVRDAENTHWLNMYGWVQRLTGSAIETLAGLVDAGYKVDLDSSTTEMRGWALQCYLESAGIARKLSGDAPDSVEFKRDVVLSMTRAGSVSERLEMPGEALAYYRAALVPATQLHDLDSTNALWTDDLSFVDAAIRRLDDRPSQSVH